MGRQFLFNTINNKWGWVASYIREIEHIFIDTMTKWDG